MREPRHAHYRCLLAPAPGRIAPSRSPSNPFSRHDLDLSECGTFGLVDGEAQPDEQPQAQSGRPLEARAAVSGADEPSADFPQPLRMR
jgi:hypothetical protein